MIKIEKLSWYGFDTAIRGMRNPMNSWNKSDSDWQYTNLGENGMAFDYQVGPSDLRLMQSLSSKGPVHGKFKRMITVTCDITAPLYWWKEFDTYKVGTVANSCSTMHKIHVKEFVIDNFSYEHLLCLDDFDVVMPQKSTDKRVGCVWYNDSVVSPLGCLDLTIKLLNEYRHMFLKTNNKKFWWQMIQLLPSSYNQKRTVQMNYEVLTNIYMNRKDHKLDEWREFCKFMKENLPFPELFTGEGLCVCEE